MSSQPESQSAPLTEYDKAVYDRTLVNLDRYFTVTGGFDYEAWDEGLPDDSAGVLASKHRGHLDPPLLAVVANYEYQRRVRFLTAERLLKGRLGPTYNKFFHQLGCIMFDDDLALDKQPAGQEILQAFADEEIPVIFPEAKIVEGAMLGKTRKIGGIATAYEASITAVGVAGTEFKPGQWFGPKTVVLGRTSHPDLEKLSQLDPEVRADQRELLRYTKNFSKDVHNAIQEATTIAERNRSRQHFAVSRPKNTPKRRRSQA